MRKALIVDDHPFIREMVKMLLIKANFQIVGETDNGATALELARQHIPHLIILDLSMPKLDGLEVLGRLSLLGLPIKVLVLTSKESSIYADRCLRAGATGYMEKSESVELLAEAINKVMDGRLYLNDAGFNISDDILVGSDDAVLVKSLTPRELTTLQHLAVGKNNKKIAEIMLLSEKTVSTYKTRLLEKLNVKSVIYLADFAKRNKLIE